MIPSADAIIAGYPFAARRWGLSGEVSERAIRAAVDDARALTGGDPMNEPAAVFFAFARRPRAFPGAWRLMPALLALNQVRAVGCRLRADRDAMNGLIVGIASRTVEFDDVRAWFAHRIEAREPR